MLAMANTGSAREIVEGGNYLGLSLIRAPKANHRSIEQIGKPIVQWFKKHGTRPEIYHLSMSEFPQSIESITKTLSIKDENILLYIVSKLIKKNGCKNKHSVL